jgi:putative ABC transport system substrate-binding protein
LAVPHGHASAQPKAFARVGVLTLGVAPGSPLVESFRQGLRDLGYQEGRDLALDFRYAQGRSEALPSLAAQLVSDRVDVIVTESNAAAVAARDAAPNMPIVLALAGDPVKAGVVDSLGRPGGNVTGLTLVVPELSAKRLQLLKQAAPKVDLVAVIWNPGNPAAADSLQETMAAARLIGVRLHPIEVRSPAELDHALDAVKSFHPSGLVAIADGMLAAKRARIVQFALDNRMPGVFPQREFTEEGGLLSYGPDLAAVFRRAAVFVDRILKGAKPADLPTEQPTRFELVINTRTAKAIGIAIPNALLQRADQLIN